jgi:hypothetical protein
VKWLACYVFVRDSYNVFAIESAPLDNVFSIFWVLPYSLFAWASAVRVWALAVFEIGIFVELLML